MHNALQHLNSDRAQPVCILLRTPQAGGVTLWRVAGLAASGDIPPEQKKGLP